MSTKEQILEIRFTKSDELLAFLDKLDGIKRHAVGEITRTKVEKVKAAAINRFLDSINLQPRQKTAGDQLSLSHLHGKRAAGKSATKKTKSNK